MAKVTLDMNAVDDLSSRAVEGGVRAVLGKAERLLKEDILNRPGTGRQYGLHRASAPGQPPAPDIGNLRAQTNADPTLREEGDETVGQITADAAYAEALEKGTERIAARPFFGLLVSEHSDDLARAFSEGALR
jgi:hypothetical protein